MRAVIAEDSVLLRIGLVKVLQTAGFEVAAETDDADGLLAAVEEHRPDIAVVDVRMPPGFTDEGVRAALLIRRQWPDTAVLLLSQYVEERYAADLLTAHTSGIGYLLKQRVADVEDFIAALHRVAGGGTALDPQVVAQLLVRHRGPLDRLSSAVTRRRVCGCTTSTSPVSPASAGSWRPNPGQRTTQQMGSSATCRGTGSA
ncbi:response regulator (plasmid) [Streptomyces sp. LZ34]